MRPPDHWHLQPRRTGRRRRVLWAAAAVVFLAALVSVVVLLRPDGSGPAEVRTVEPAGAAAASSGECAEGCGADRFSDPLAVARAAPPAIGGRAAAVIEASCGAVVYGKEMHAQLRPASLTKIATALVTVERADLSRTVEVDVNGPLLAASTGSSIMGLQRGQRLTIGELLYGLMLPSGNDAALELAQEVAGGEDAFVALMNDKAGELGLEDTHFENPHGLDERGHLSSAYDMALLGREALRDPALAAVVRTKTFRPDWDGGELWNGNALLETYPGAIGVKIGYTNRARETIVAAAERGGRTIIVSVLASEDRAADAAALLDWAFEATDPACSA